MGMNDINSLSRSKLNCKFHIIFALKYRRKVFYKQKILESEIFSGSYVNGKV